MTDFPPLLSGDIPKRIAPTTERIIRKDMRSADWDGGGDLSGGVDTDATAGYLIDYGSGAAQFQSIYADGGEIANLDITGTLTMDTNGLIRTGSSPNERIEIDGTGDGEVRFYTDAAWEVNPGALVGRPLATNYPGVALYSGSAYDDPTTYPGYYATVSIIGFEVTNDARTTSLCSFSETTAAFNGSVISGNSVTTDPGFTFFGSTNDGIYNPAANEVGIKAGNGTVAFWADGTTVEMLQVYSGASGTANVVVDSDGTLHRSGSAAKYKQKVKDVKATFADIALQPVEYWTNIKDANGDPIARWDDQHAFGFIADDIAAQEHDLGVWAGGVIEDYDTRGVMAVMAAKINRLEALAGV